jgi:hypothetical protein
MRVRHSLPAAKEGDDLIGALPDVLALRPNGGAPPPTSRTLIHYPEVDVK